MADKILLRAGKKANMPTLADREPAYVTDDNAIYVGTPGGNKKVGGNSAYECAKQGGYTGTEAEFCTALANMLAVLQTGKLKLTDEVTGTAYMLTAESGTLVLVEA